MSPVDAVPRDVWQLIFLFLASECSPGPPSAIIPLILTNWHMHELFCGCKSENAHLYGDMFVDYFDIRAPRRRLGFNFTTSSCCSMELRDRLACIKRIRHRTHQFLQPDVLTEDLCRCFCMLLERYVSLALFPRASMQSRSEATTRMLNCSSVTLALQPLSWIRRGPTYLRRRCKFHTISPMYPFYFGWCG
jgi:hypothetical protein